jgi:hypothetical protein
VKLISPFAQAERRDPRHVRGSWMSETSFDRVISEHLALCERNRRLERQMPLDDYREGGSPPPVARGARPKDEPETETVVNAGQKRQEHWLDSESFWDTSGERPLPEFDWGDE